MNLSPVALPDKKIEDMTMYEVFRILDSFNVPLGAAEGEGALKTEGMRSSTIWTSAYDTKNLVMHYHTQHNRRVRQVDLKKVDFSSKNLVRLAARQGQATGQVTGAHRQNFADAITMGFIDGTSDEDGRYRLRGHLRQPGRQHQIRRQEPRWPCAACCSTRTACCR